MKNNLNLIKIIKCDNNYIDIVDKIPKIDMSIYDNNIIEVKELENKILKYDPDYIDIIIYEIVCIDNYSNNKYNFIVANMYKNEVLQNEN